MNLAEDRERLLEMVKPVAIPGLEENPAWFGESVAGPRTILWEALDAVKSIAVDAAFGPQTALTWAAGEAPLDYSMALLDLQRENLKTHLAADDLRSFAWTRDPDDLVHAIKAVRPEAWYHELKTLGPREPLYVAPTHLFEEPPSIAAFKDTWLTTVSKNPFESDATNLFGRARDWMDWRYDPSNYTTTSDFGALIETREPGFLDHTRVRIRDIRPGNPYDSADSVLTESTIQSQTREILTRDVPIIDPGPPTVIQNILDTVHDHSPFDNDYFGNDFGGGYKW